MKGTWMLLVLAILLLFGPEGPVMADGRTLMIDLMAGTESGANDRLLLFLFLSGPAAAETFPRGRRTDDEA